MIICVKKRASGLCKLPRRQRRILRRETHAVRTGDARGTLCNGQWQCGPAEGRHTAWLRVEPAVAAAKSLPAIVR
jgi:hypothetical protein